MLFSITEESLAGAQMLPFADRHHFELNLTDLLDQSTQCKKQWLLYAMAVTQRHERQQAANAGLQAVSVVTSKLLK